jgi:hypothetical protein
LVLGAFFTALALATFQLRADQIELQSGDRYVGKILSLATDTLTLQSEVLGTLKLPRNKIATIHLGAGASTNSTLASPSTNPSIHQSTNPSDILPANAVVANAAALHQLKGDTNLVEQVQSQFLNDASPEAKAKFHELLGGYMSGKISINDIRTQARSAVDQIRELKREGGDQIGDSLDGYLTILEKFLGETTAPADSHTNAPAPRKRSGSASAAP